MEPIFQDVLNRHLGETGMRECHLNPEEPRKYHRECYCGAHFYGSDEFCSEECYNAWDGDCTIPCTGCGENHEGDCK